MQCSHNGPSSIRQPKPSRPHMGGRPNTLVGNALSAIWSKVRSYLLLIARYIPSMTSLRIHTHRTSSMIPQPQPIMIWLDGWTACMKLTKSVRLTHPQATISMGSMNILISPRKIWHRIFVISSSFPGGSARLNHPMRKYCSSPPRDVSHFPETAVAAHKSLPGLPFI